MSWLFDLERNQSTSVPIYHHHAWKTVINMVLTILVCLLLRCGDIEVNPGPGRFAGKKKYLLNTINSNITEDQAYPDHT